MKKFKEFNGPLNLVNSAKDMLKYWDNEAVFKKTLEQRKDADNFVFFEGPPSANGMPGIHHVIGRTIKDIFCRYKTLQGFAVNRKAGWDTHGLPVELSVEKELGITKEDIGNKISVTQYNDTCKETVMRYTDVWNDLTKKMGYWVDMDEPYITYTNKYMESVWWLLSQLHKKELLYKGYTIQPYSPKAGTGLSTHELNQPGCYKNVKDTTIVAQFKTIKNDFLPENTYFLAWTTTPWTLPSNTALAVGKKIEYVLISSFNQYTKEPIQVVLAKNLISKQFGKKFTEVNSKEELLFNEKNIPFLVERSFTGQDIIGLRYEQLLPYALPHEDPEKAFQVIGGDFVTTEDGTGIVHIAPTFGADDAMVAKTAGVPPMLVLDDEGNPIPLVDLQGRFTSHMKELGGMYVKQEYYEENEAPEKSVDVLIAIQLKQENKAFQVAKYEHSYPHCWRTDKPVLYYPLDSWFIKTTNVKDKLIALNKTINWKPKSTGEGRFGNWLENLNDWNLSRSRYWGIPIPIWRTEDGKESTCIDSIEMLKKACEESVNKGFMQANPFKDFIPGDFSSENYSLFDIHKHEVDNITLVSASGQPMKRESDLIDVWFDSGSMPYAQWHYPFENKEYIDNSKYFPADFIAEGVDQTRGWFFTLHAIAGMVFDSIAYKNVISNGLVLDKNGHKMSKRLGNGVDPFETLEKYGPDATRWYMVTNAQPWDNLKFDTEGITEVQRKFFGTLHNTYNFFALYANIDGFNFSEEEIAINERPEIDRWVLSKLNTLIGKTEENFNNYEPTKAGRLIQEFVTEDLSNWYVRLCRRRFWKGDYSTDKISAYQTLYLCLYNVSIMASPIAPFYMDELFQNLSKVTNSQPEISVHATLFPKVKQQYIDIDLEERMELAQRITSMVLGLRKKQRIKVRQPLQKIMIPVSSEKTLNQIKAVEKLILSEVNIKEIEYLTDTSVFKKTIKANFKALGPKHGKNMKAVAAAIQDLEATKINELEAGQILSIALNSDTSAEISAADVIITTADIPGYAINSDGKQTVALDISISEELKNEGIAREFVNRIQNLRKDTGLEVTDKIALKIQEHQAINEALKSNSEYICAETLAEKLDLVGDLDKDNAVIIDVDENISTYIALQTI